MQNIRRLLIFRHLIKLQVLVNLVLVRLDLLFVDLEELGRLRQSSQQRRYRAQLGGTEIDLGAVTDAVIEVTGRGGEHVDPVRYSRLVAHAERAAGDFDTSAE